MALVDIIHNISFFNSLEKAELGTLLAEFGKRITLEPGTIVFETGDAADSMYIILTGCVRISKIDDDGNELTLSELGTGEFFGELALIDGGTRSARAVIVETSELFTLSRNEFMEFLSKSPKLLSNLFVGISSKVRSANDKVMKDALLAKELEIQKHRAISEMVTGVAHEINTPIGIINTAASCMVEQLADDLIKGMAKDDDAKTNLEEIRETAQLVMANVARASKLIQNFKNLSSQQLTEKPTVTKLPELISEIVDLYRIEARSAGIEVEIINKLSADSQRWVGCPGFLSQVLLNLLQNILRYAYPDKGGKVEIEILSDSTGGGARFVINVTDFGKGIEPDNLPRVFDAFYTTGRDRGGTGLGMTIVRNIVTGPMKGTVSMTSTPGQGTTVTVKLPKEISLPEKE